jgi:hypothetical protein
MRTGARQPSLTDRQQAAAAAKKEALERHRARLSDPEFEERRAARLAIVAARETRFAERSAAEEAQQVREAAEKATHDAAVRAAREAALQAEITARQAAAEERSARLRAVETDLLNTRKARKAARKAKKRGR